MDDPDVVIRGGTIIDGTGGAMFSADVAIKGGKIVDIGALPRPGEQEIDARGCIVTPGFVDVHTHYDGQVTWENRLQPASYHGITTVVMGNCGVGFAPVRPADIDLTMRLMEGVEDIPFAVMANGVPFNWETFADYLDAIEARHADLDFCAQLPHSPLRVYVMGERAVLHEPPTEADLRQMRRLTAEAIRAGALGVTTSRSVTHRFLDGDVVPSVLAGDAELVALAAGLRDAGAGVFQIAPDAGTIGPELTFALLRKLARQSGRPLSFAFVQMANQPGGWRFILDEIGRAQKEGLEIRGQVIPRPVGVLMSLELTLHPFSFNPSFREIENLPLREKVAAMREPSFRTRVIAEEPTNPHDFFRLLVSERDLLFRLGDPPNYNPDADESVGAMSRAQGRDAAELIYDLLLEKDGREMLYRPLGNIDDTPRFEGAGRYMLGDSRTVIGLGDGGAHCSMICDGTLTTYFLTYWVKDADASRMVPLNKAVRMLTREPAELVGLRDRGLLKIGYKADINVIDFDRLRLKAPYASFDLPGGGRRLSQTAEGYTATLVSGVVTYRDGEATGALPGRLQRFARRDPTSTSLRTTNER